MAVSEECELSYPLGGSGPSIRKHDGQRQVWNDSTRRWVSSGGPTGKRVIASFDASRQPVTELIDLGIASLQKKLDQEREEAKAGPDWWLHLKDKYTVKDRYKPRITKKHPYAYHNSSKSVTAFVLDLRPGSTSFIGQSIYFDGLDAVERHLKGLEIEFTIVDRTKDRDFDNLAQPDKVADVVGWGTLCKGSCIHYLRFEDESGAEFGARYCGKNMIRDIYTRLEIEIPDHFT